VGGGRELELRRDEVRLACLDFGGDGPAALLLHGLAGHAGEWAQTASWLTARCRVVAYDARGHGHSVRSPADVSREAHVADAAFVLEELGLAPAIVIGQSLGGHTALLLAAERPELVRALVLAEAGPSDGDASEAAHLGEALAAWPLPFPSRDAVVEHFGGPGLRAEAWAGGFEQRPDGWWPRFDAPVMEATLRAAMERPSWPEWKRIRCPVLVVRGREGSLAAAVARDMFRRNRRARVVELPGGHDVHLESPAEWQAAVEAFLTAAAGPAA
jgi:pimeloyl-ACP methyl ester carboxylesterase